MRRFRSRHQALWPWLAIAGCAVAAPALAERPVVPLAVTVTVAQPAPKAPPVEGELVWERYGAGRGEDGDGIETVVPLHGPGRITLDAGERGSGRLLARVPGYWAADQVLVRRRRGRSAGRR